MSMRVNQWMTKNPLSVSGETELAEAYRILREYEIRHLPVTDGSNRVIGLVSDHDIGQEFLSHFSDSRGETMDRTVREVMTTNVQTVRPDEPVSMAALVMHNRKIGCLPVLGNRNELVGILTTNDLLEILVSLLPTGGSHDTEK